jgi:hypothetical protein
MLIFAQLNQREGNKKSSNIKRLEKWEKIRAPKTDRSIINRRYPNPAKPWRAGAFGHCPSGVVQDVSCRNQILDILEEKILKGKRVTGRPGMEFACFIYFVNPHTGIKGGITVVSIDMNPRWGYACNKYLLFSGGCMNFLGTTELFIFCYWGSTKVRLSFDRCMI